jgi:hypothetical protein
MEKRGGLCRAQYHPELRLKVLKVSGNSGFDPWNYVVKCKNLHIVRLCFEEP